METWLIAVVIVVPVVCLAVPAAVIGFLCMRYWKRKRSQIGTTNTGYSNHGVQSNVDNDVESQRRAQSNIDNDVESQRRAQSNVDNDVESQRKASSHDEPETRTVNGNPSLVTVVDEEKVASGSVIEEQSYKEISHVTINNEERVPHNFGTETIMDKVNLWRAIHINKERVQDNFQLGIIGKENISPFSSTHKPSTNINELRTRFIEQRAAQRLEIPNIRKEIVPAKEYVSLSTSQQQKLHSNITSTNVQNQTKAKSTDRPAVTPNTRYVENFTIKPKSNFNTSTGHRQLDLHYYSLKDAMAVFKHFLQESITDYERSNYSRNMRFIEVITGRGKHSPGGIPVIKPAVEGYLMAHDHTYSWTNPGLVRIDLLPFRA